ncbi:protein PTST homolog 2, chloroplastic isoform X2 [Lotus japonicus]|uniref:protein PTST homolog 2, chloroplastic isoform X2 n=1 Tax=Lotus japonicus TaxID=34305 RepID=UPI0025831FC2|nr:protein PTST homolog 2, chloroplastic isoform X2 [Lotus japonicus]
MHSLTARSPSMLIPHLTPSLVPPHFASFRRVERFAALCEPGSVLWREGPFRNGSVGSVSVYKGLCSVWRCKGRDGSGEGEAFSSLEAEILEFMQKSENPGAFPTKNELVAAGRVDLVEAIVEEGGWLAYGWDLNDGFLESHDLEDGSGSEIEYNATWASGVASTSSTSSSANSSQPAKSVEFEAEESGIEGILNRLEKYRSNSFGSGFRGKEDSTSSENNEDRDEWDHRTPTNAVKLDQHKSQLGTDSFRNSLKPEMWKSWVIQRNGSQDADFEDAEIVPSEAPKGVSNVSGRPDILKTNKFSSELRSRETGWDSVDGIRNANHIDIKSRLQHLESELSSALHVMRSITPKASMDLKSSSDDLAKLSDALEFRENEIMHAQDTLRSLRAKLSVLEGKMAMKKMDAQKAAEEKQKKIKNANKAVNLLKSVDIVWPKPASEVFLVGSFDGWSFKRKMERSVTGVFTLALYLYPGTYEIKFIVDGEWQIDPLLPIVNNNGHENNVLTVRDWRRA